MLESYVIVDELKRLNKFFTKKFTGEQYSTYADQIVQHLPKLRKHQLEKAVDELIANAGQFMPAFGVVISALKKSASENNPQYTEEERLEGKHLSDQGFKIIPRMNEYFIDEFTGQHRMITELNEWFDYIAAIGADRKKYEELYGRK